MGTLGSEEPILLPVLLRGVGLRLSQRPLHKASRQLISESMENSRREKVFISDE